MTLRKAAVSLFSIILLATCFVQAKDQPPQVIVWPQSGTPVLRFTFGKFKELGSAGSQRSYIVETTAENLWSKKISQASFSLYLFDKAKARIAEAWITVNDLGPGQSAKFQTAFGASGLPVSLELVAKSIPPELGPAAPPRTISITVNSVPQGASLKVDGVDAGTTPKAVQVGVGKHMLEFSKEGFNTGHFPLEVTASDVSGGSVSYELGTAAHDTVELRDGSVLTGDLESVTASEVVLRIGGAPQHFNRNQVKRILLVERDAASTQ